MPKAIKYVIFPTGWGYFGLAGTTRLSSSKSEYGLLRTHLPLAEREKVKCRLLKDLQAAEYDKALFKTLQEQITAYFEGACVNFGRDILLDLTGLTRFTKLVLAGCRDIRFGQTISYGRLAEKIGRPAAARAVGMALAKNPLPLIIPCHRVTYSNGKIGGFSAPDGKNLKKKLLRYEQKGGKV